MYCSALLSCSACMAPVCILTSAKAMQDCVHILHTRMATEVALFLPPRLLPFQWTELCRGSPSLAVLAAFGYPNLVKEQSQTV